MQMPPLRDCKVKNPMDPRNIKEDRIKLREDESTLLIQPNKKQNPDAEMKESELLTYSL